MHKRLFVSNLAETVTEEELSALFAEYGEINSVSIARRRDGDREGMIAFVEMATDVGARGVLENLNGFKFEGRKLRIDEAPERVRSGGRSLGS